jgi:hypothetical protein
MYMIWTDASLLHDLADHYAYFMQWMLMMNARNEESFLHVISSNYTTHLDEIDSRMNWLAVLIDRIVENMCGNNTDVYLFSHSRHK